MSRSSSTTLRVQLSFLLYFQCRPAVNSFRLKARLLNEMVQDITDWVFRDVTPGRSPFKLKTISTGTMSGVIESRKSVHINGENLPHFEKATVEWAIQGTTQSGTVAASKLSGDCDRMDIAADAMSSIVTQANDGKTIDIIVRGNYTNAKISAVLKYVPLPTTTISNYTATNSEEGTSVLLNVTNPEGVIDYVMDGDGPSVTAKFYVGTSTNPDSKTISRGTDGKWFVLLVDGSSVPTGQSLKIVLEHDPAKTEYEPVNAEATTVVTAG